MRTTANADQHSTALARNIALGHHIEDAFMKGKLHSHAGAADTLRISKARVSQLIALAFLAPDIQEEFLFMDPGRVDRPPSLVDRSAPLVGRSQETAPTSGVPLALCSIEQLHAEREDVVGAKTTTSRREALLIAIVEARLRDDEVLSGGVGDESTANVGPG